MLRSSLLAALSLALAAFPLRAADPIPLWPNGAPGALGTAERDIPTLTAYLPDPVKATGAAMLVCPGGGYAVLQPGEGQGYAEWLAQNGIAGLVLKYRLGTSGYHHPAMLNDATRAMRLARSKAAEWKIDPKRIGVIGSSAGGHLASTLVTHFDLGHPDDPDPIEHESSRPDLGVLCYAVITMGPNSDPGSRLNLLGKEPTPELVDLLSNEKQVTKDTPPCFIFHTWEDRVVKVENALSFAEALQKAGVRYDLHIYERGAHGLELGGKPGVTPLHPWTNDLLYWFKAEGFLK